MSADYAKYKDLLGRIADVSYASAVLSWDQEVMMPPKGADSRARQLATLAGISHVQSTSDELGALLEKLSKDNSLTEIEKKNVERSRKDFKERKKYSVEFVEQLNRAASEGFHAWQKAKELNQFNLFEPKLQELVELKRKECKILGYTDHPYDALLDQFEPGMTTKAIETLFSDVRKELVPFVKQIAGSAQNNNGFLKKNYSKDTQWQYGLDILKQMGYDFEAGRQDISSHPFTTSFCSEDVRVTTRINEHDFSEMLWSTIHEGGHALYEQGLLKENYGLPSGEAASLGIHESQSRLWENNVGRCLPFWKAHYKNLQNLFPDNLGSVPVLDFVKAINQVKPSFVRTNADELTYHFHIMIRFEIEKALIEGSIEVKQLPSVWNSKYKEYLGIDVPDDSHGVLQDVHWSHGGFGYFPTYSLGSFYAAQFYSKAKSEINNLEEEIEKGNTTPLLHWLREKIHIHGKNFTSEELCQAVTAEKLNFSHFMDYARRKYAGIYALELVE